jgi:hypothetical protein
LLGAALWVGAAGVLLWSGVVVASRAARSAEEIVIEPPRPARLQQGDSVFLQLNDGLAHIGEVAAVENDGRRIRLAIRPEPFAALDERIRATCWHTPMSAEEALGALLPPAVQRRAMERINEDWQHRRVELFEAWRPIAAELAGGYFAAISDELEDSLRAHEDELLNVLRAHGDELAANWPAIQTRLRPILAEHLTPVLGRLMDQAVADAPKTKIAWSLARGRHEQAFQQMLDWLNDYLAEMPQKDRAELAAAARRSWNAARDDEVLVDLFAGMGRDLLTDDALRTTLQDIFHDAVTNNPDSAAYLQQRVLASPTVHDQLYKFIEVFAPTARGVAAICLFDESGMTRPEVVHLVRSATLRRQMAWVTLTPSDFPVGPSTSTANPPADSQPAPLAPGAVLAADMRGSPD